METRMLEFHQRAWTTGTEAMHADLGILVRVMSHYGTTSQQMESMRRDGRLP